MWNVIESSRLATIKFLKCLESLVIYILLNYCILLCCSCCCFCFSYLLFYVQILLNNWCLFFVVIFMLNFCLLCRSNLNKNKTKKIFFLNLQIILTIVYLSLFWTSSKKTSIEYRYYYLLLLYNIWKFYFKNIIIVTNPVIWWLLDLSSFSLKYFASKYWI